MPVVQPTPSVANPGGRRIITFGTFDLFHVGHVNVLRRARGLGDWLIVGISSDELNARKKGRQPYFSIDDARLLNQLPVWAPDAATRRKILVDNPVRLYGF